MRLPIITTKFVVLGAMVLAIIGGVIALQLVTFTTSNAAFCLSCHGTGETRDMSKQSKVHPAFDQVTCVDCHAKPGQFIPEGYRGGFSAEPNAIASNCERCHAEMKTKNTQEGFRYNINNIRIPHKFHLETVGANCTDCHANISHDRQEEPTNRPRMDYCFRCHQSAESRSCSKCHPSGLPSPAAGAAKPSSSTIDARELFNRNCSVCHGAKGDQLERANLHSKDFLKGLDDRTLHQVIVDGKGAMPAVSMTQGVNLTEEEVQALIAFIKTLPDAGQDASSAAQSEGRSLFGTYCSMCHGAKGDSVASANIGDKAFLDSRGDDAVNNSILKGKGAMPAQGKSAGGQLTDAQVTSIVAYLKYLASGATQNTTTSAGPTREGQTIFAKNCAACHGQNGSTLAAANLRSKAFLGSRSDDALQKAVGEGKGSMPPFGSAKGGSLSDAQVKEVVEYIKTLAVDP